MEYIGVIFDECHCVVKYISDMTDEEIEEYLENHPEYYIGCVCISEF